MRRIETMDILNGYGGGITLWMKGGEIKKVMPREERKIENSQWLGDKSRFGYDSIACQRKEKVWEGSRLISWWRLIKIVVKKIKQRRLRGTIGEEVDIEGVKN